ncbi:flippase [Clostridium sp. CS001]|uniref:flippase n=1 Tax=Clostridium sp. CS001 TaxID=2880648 RepID=UPI001CF37E0F|nr:flippase [Clostridium sp. CS001]MCB2289033.1 flippase [Clostridium sp. CS001]
MNKLTKNFLSISFSNLIGQLFTFLIVIYYSGIIGKDNFGRITLAQQMLLFFTMVVLFGIQTYGTRIVSSNKENIDKVLGEIIAFRFLVSIICFIVICTIAFFINKDTSFKTIFVLFGITLIPTALNVDWLFNGLQEMQHNAIYNLCKNIIPSIIIFLFLKNQNNMSLIPIAMIIGLCVGFIYQYYIVLVKYKYKLKLTLNKKIIFKYSKVGMPFLLSGFFSMINNNADKIIIGFSRGDGELGVYQAAYVFVGFLISVATIIFTSTFPLLIKYHHEGKKEELKKICNGISKLVAIIAVPIFIGGTLLSKDIILLYKKEFFEAYKPLNILLFYILILFIREIYGYQLNAWRLEKVYLKIIIVSSIANLILNLILTPKYGMIAAALITTVTEFINLIFMRKCARKIVIVKDLYYVLQALMPGSIMALAIVVLKYMGINIFIIILISIVIYFLFAIITKVIEIEEIKTIFNKKEGA